MSTVITTTVLPDSTANDTLTFGATGDSLAISGDSLNLNTLQDAGGNNIFTSSSGTVSSTALSDSMKLLSNQSVTNQASVVFTTQLTSTYDVYIFKFININPATDSAKFSFQCSTDGGSNYNTTMTTTSFEAVYAQSGGYNWMGYVTGQDQAQGTSYQYLAQTLGNGSDECLAGELSLFAPSSTTYVKQFYARTNFYHGVNPDYSVTPYTAGYFNTTSAINAISFKMDSGNFDGIIKCYGVSKS